jgi:phosphatidylglycerophosphate synthase
VHTSVAVGLAGLMVGLTAVDVAAGLGVPGWTAGLGCGLLLAVLVSRGFSRVGRDTLTPADLVTLVRGLLACGVAAVTTQSLPGSPSGVAFLVVAVPALALDAVDGAVARRIGPASPAGARFDGEVDAFLILVLSVAAGPVVGWWVLAAGFARYAFGGAGWMLPWLRSPLPYRYWRKVVTAVVGVTLTVIAADVLPREMALSAALVSLLLLVESFGRDVSWLWRHRTPPQPSSPGRGRVRAAARAAATCTALAMGWFALLAPNRPDELSAVAFLRLPAELLILAAVALALPARARRILATLTGTLLGTLVLAKVLDLGMMATLDRPFDVVTDVGALGSGLSFVDDSLGTWAAVVSVFGVLVLLVTVAVGLPWALARTADVVGAHRRVALRALVGLAAAWAVLAVSGLRVAPDEPIAAAGAGPYVVGKVQAASGALRDRAAFEAALDADRFPDPVSANLSGLRGKDVLVVFVESYGRVALEGSGSQVVRQLLDSHAARLAAMGYIARSAFLTSPTFGGSSWLAHATLQSGVQVDDQYRYDRLLESGRTTLTSAFARAGWRTVGVLPSTRGTWPEGRAFYRFDTVYGRSDLGYHGPAFGFSAMPDQFTLAALDRLELGRPREAPVMAQVELTSSHGPWAPLPITVDWSDLGDGSVFRDIEARARSVAELWSTRSDVPAAYRTSIAYSLTSLLDFVERYPREDLVLLVLGDHQPSTIVSGFGSSRDVPVTLIAHDPEVVDRVSTWDWDTGLRPDVDAPVWPMEDLRDRLLSAFSGPAP